MAEIDNIPEMRPSFDNIRRQDEGGNEYWSSRDLCAAMGYSAYWKFQRVIDKAIKVAGEKGMNVWGIERSGFFNGREKWAKGFENQRV